MTTLPVIEQPAISTCMHACPFQSFSMKRILLAAIPVANVILEIVGLSANTSYNTTSRAAVYVSGVGFQSIITEDPPYNDNVCSQRFCCKIEFAVIKKLDRDPSKA